MKKIQKNYELNAGESFRLDKNGFHGVTAQGDVYKRQKRSSGR